MLRDYLVILYFEFINICFAENFRIAFLDIITAQKIKFSIKNFLSKCDQIRSFLWIWSHLLKKSLMENFIFCAVYGILNVSLYCLQVLLEISANSSKIIYFYFALRVHWRLIFANVNVVRDCTLSRLFYLFYI